MLCDNSLEDTSGAYNHVDSYYADSQIPLINPYPSFINNNNMTVEGKGKGKAPPHDSTEILFLLGAGASVRAGISAIVELGRFS
jgi:hypothetical protein